MDSPPNYHDQWLNLLNKYTTVEKHDSASCCGIERSSSVFDHLFMT